MLCSSSSESEDHDERTELPEEAVPMQGENPSSPTEGGKMKQHDTAWLSLQVTQVTGTQQERPEITKMKTQ